MPAARSRGGLDWLLRALSFLVVLTVITMLLDRGVLTIGHLALLSAVLLVLGLVLGQLLVVPWLARRAPQRPRIQDTATWECPLSPAEALERIRAALTDLDPTVLNTPTTLELSVGSDVTFRRRGMGSETGWRDLPQHAAFYTLPRPGGCQITATVRDDLGWYPDPPPQLITDELGQRNRSIIDRATHATTV